MTPAIKIKNLSYAYQSNWTFRRKPFLKNVDLEIMPGEAFGFLGHNGAGKTTTIKCLIGLTKPNSGTIEILGRSSKDYQVRKNIGFLPEQPYFYDNIKVKELMFYFATLKEIPKNQQKSEVSDKLERVGMSKFYKRPLKSLSKGQVQRVAMAQAMLGDPEIYILDEPFSGLDPIGRKEFADLFFDLKSKGAAMLISTHILSDIESFCDRVSIMVEGEIKGIYSLEELPKLLPGIFYLKVKNYKEIEEELKKDATLIKEMGRSLYLEYDLEEKANQALSATLRSDAAVEEYKFKHGGLEELFIDLMK